MRPPGTGDGARSVALRAAALVGVSAALGACSGPREVVIENDAHPAAVEVLVDGKSVGTFSGREIRVKVPAWSPKRDGVRSRLLPDRGGAYGSGVMVRVQTACGPVTFLGRDPVRPAGAASEGLRFRFTEVDLSRRPGRPPVFIDLEEAWFDNRWGAPAQLQVGSFRYDIAPGTSGPRGIPAALCPAEQAVSLNGRRIGDFPLVSRRLSERGLRPRAVFVVDTSGRRCYDETIYQYGLAGGGPTGVTSRGKHLHALDTDHVTDFLVKAPESIGTVAGGGSRTQLMECGEASDTASRPP